MFADVVCYSFLCRTQEVDKLDRDIRMYEKYLTISAALFRFDFIPTRSTCYYMFKLQACIFVNYSCHPICRSFYHIVAEIMNFTFFPAASRKPSALFLRIKSTKQSHQNLAIGGIINKSDMSWYSCSWHI